ncbi:NUDIX hydrolase [Crossiella sp. CA-258035]|uniref:NUDIX domain-containing protein n=1 Tax=Crossiella sp. CA-258035 TaxID=2981138 RepID=UPI0024BD3260|nr:NUDIX hydrolase [Crossiella sp. CA-258035]WHT17668.1 NUDIX hydrolase [Crossiella sp. CA-258035]
MGTVERGAHEFSVANSQDVYAGRVMALRVDDVVMPGGEVATREVIEHPGAVGVVALDENDNVVLIHQYRHPVGQRLWELPAGLLDAEGEDPAVTAARELAEEVGLAAADWSVLVDVSGSPGFMDEVIRVYLARGLSTVDQLADTGDEEADLVVRRVPLSEAVRMVLSGAIINAATVSGVLAAHAVLSGAAQTRPVDAPWESRPHRFAQRQSGQRRSG